MHRYKTMAEVANELIRERIIKGQYLPGDRLKPPEMETDLDLGRVAIREALKELIGSGLVESIPNKGFQVASLPSFGEITNLFESRYILEGGLAFEATETTSLKTIEQLKSLYQQMENNLLDDKDLFLLNRKFHLTLYETSGWFKTCRIVSQMMDQIILFYSFHIRDQTFKIDFKPFNEEHLEILKALKNRDSSKVKEITKSNIRRGYEQIKDTFEKYNSAQKIEQIK